MPRQPQVKFQTQPQIIGDSSPSYGGDSSFGVSSEKECTNSTDSGASLGDFTKSMSSGVSFGDSTKSGGTDSGACPQDSPKFNDSGTSSKNSTKFSGLGLSCEDSTKLENSLDVSSLDPSVFEEESSSRENFQSAEADTSLETSKVSGPTSVLPQTEEQTSKKASTSSDGDDSQDSGPVQAIEPRRSLRSTKGAPPTRYGYAITHKLVCPYFQFMKNGKVQLPSKL